MSCIAFCFQDHRGMPDSHFLARLPLTSSSSKAAKKLVPLAMYYRYERGTRVRGVLAGRGATPKQGAGWVRRRLGLLQSYYRRGCMSLRGCCACCACCAGLLRVLRVCCCATVSRLAGLDVALAVDDDLRLAAHLDDLGLAVGLQARAQARQRTGQHAIHDSHPRFGLLSRHDDIMGLTIERDATAYSRDAC